MHSVKHNTLNITQFSNIIINITHDYGDNNSCITYMVLHKMYRENLLNRII